MRILHVAEVEGGGVWDAIFQYSRNLPDFEHVVAGTDADYLTKFPPETRTVHLSGGLRRHRATVQRLVDEIQPDVIHAHSSFAGVTCRTARLRGRPVLYQPHAFYFSNESLGRPKRLVYWIAEKLLARRATGFVAVSAHEAEQMARLSRRVPVFRVRNTSRLAVPSARHPGPAFRVVTSGRASPQKSPELFAAIADRVRTTTQTIEFVWLGDGDDHHRRILEAGGVRVSGWLDRATLARELQQAHVYLHTALYEGFPQSIVDAAVVGLPMLVRDRPYARELDVEKFSDAAGAAASLVRWQQAPSELAEQEARSHELRAHFRPEDQQTELRFAYVAALRPALA